MRGNAASHHACADDGDFVYRHIILRI